jgi:hypothetical protein
LLNVATTTAPPDEGHFSRPYKPLASKGNQHLPGETYALVRRTIMTMAMTTKINTIVPNPMYIVLSSLCHASHRDQCLHV